MIKYVKCNCKCYVVWDLSEMNQIIMVTFRGTLKKQRKTKRDLYKNRTGVCDMCFLC